MITDYDTNRPSELLTPDEVKRIIGYKSKTNHGLRLLEKKGRLFPVRITKKTLRYRAEDVAKLIEDGRPVR